MASIKSPVDFEETATRWRCRLPAICWSCRGRPTTGGAATQERARSNRRRVANIRADTTIGNSLFVRPVFDWDGSVGADCRDESLSRYEFALNVAKIDDNPTADGYDGTVNVDSSTLFVNTGTVTPLPAQVFLPQPWRMDGEMNFINSGGGVPRLLGSPMFLNGDLNVSGGEAEFIAPAQLEDGSINVASGATLEQLNTFNQIDGRITSTAVGRLVSRMRASRRFVRRVASCNDGKVELRGTTHFYSGFHLGDGGTSLYGNANVHTNTILGVNFDFRDGSTTDIPGGIQLADQRLGPRSRRRDFTGDGVFRVSSTGELRLDDLASVAVDVENAGYIQFGDSPGRATIASYTQLSLGTLEIELGGTVPGSQYDALKVLGKAELDGLLQVSWIDLGIGYEPAAGDFFDVLVADRVIDKFANESLPMLPSGLEWDLDYDLHRLRLEVLALAFLAGDFDEDGDVDGEDFLAWQRGFGTASGCHPHGRRCRWGRRRGWRRLPRLATRVR